MFTLYDEEGGEFALIQKLDHKEAFGGNRKEFWDFGFL